MQTLKISDNGRYLIYADGSPFFYLGDTAWELFHRLKREEALQYLQNRASKGFTVIQAVILAELDGLHTPNAYGELPLHKDDPTQPNPAYFEHVDWIIEQATELGLYVGLLPTWGDKWNRVWGVGPEIFNPNNAQAYGRWLGQRYAEKAIIWILGGDRTAEQTRHTAIIQAMAEGLRQGDGGAHLISYHPGGPYAYSNMFHAEDWLDFNMVQSGHTRPNCPTYTMISSDYLRSPAKPCMDAEPCYEDHPVMTPSWQRISGAWYDDLSVRQAAYWAVFAGAHGHTYGCQPIWQMYQPGREPLNIPRRSWQEALDLPGAGQMRHLRNLMEGRAYLSRIPDQDMLLSPAGEGDQHIRATRDREGSYALIYFPAHGRASIDLERLGAPYLSVSWFDPRNGSQYHVTTLEARQAVEFETPSGGPDWVLVLERASQ